MPCEVSEERFDEIVGEAIDLIPEELARHMENVAILTADAPSPDQARRLRRGTTLLGLYDVKVTAFGDDGKEAIVWNR